jgi:excisionase family DNA binding protein
MTPETTLSPVLNVREVAAHLRLSPASIYRLLKLRAIPAFRAGGDWRFRTDEINRWRTELEKGDGK